LVTAGEELQRYLKDAMHAQVAVNRPVRSVIGATAGRSSSRRPATRCPVAATN